MPDSNALQEAFDRLDLLVVYDQYMTETAKHAHYVLPATHHLEGWGLGYNYNVCHCLPYLMLREPAVQPLEECKSALEFYAGLAEACGFGELFPWKSDEELIAHEVAPSGLDFETLKASQGGALFQEKTYGLEGRPFPTPSGKIEIYSHAFEEAGFDPLPIYLEPFKSPQGPMWEKLGARYPLVLSTGTRVLSYNGTQLHNVKSLQRSEPFPRAEIGPQTAAAFDISHEDDVIVETDRGWVKMRADVSERTMEGVVLVPHGWEGEANCNRLTDAQCREPIMGYPQWKGLLCNIRKAL
jgi:anaerobic selenocysteine-containing dehydrogenase